MKMRTIERGKPVYTHEKLDSFNLIVRGTIGIFYPDHKKINKIQDKLTTIVYLNEAEANERRERKQKNTRRKKINSMNERNEYSTTNQEKTLNILGQFSKLVDCEFEKNFNPLN